MEDILKDLRGVVDVRAKLLENNLGEVEILYSPEETTLKDLKITASTAGGERHSFTVIAAREDR
ncbi:MAG: hypothetical protein ACE10H_02010 [Candidatus Binatia bacterium]